MRMTTSNAPLWTLPAAATTQVPTLVLPAMTSTTISTHATQTTAIIRLGTPAVQKVTQICALGMINIVIRLVICA